MPIDVPYDASMIRDFLRQLHLEWGMRLIDAAAGAKAIPIAMQDEADVIAERRGGFALLGPSRLATSSEQDVDYEKAHKAFPRAISTKAARQVALLDSIGSAVNEALFAIDQGETQIAEWGVGEVLSTAGRDVQRA